ncbi:MAG: type II/IV secretion system protein [Sulfurimonas sp.]|nr:MAG: type II/IV secretion system protein [Sulfurimonas sp.]
MKKAFTMLELVIVIVIIGILAATVTPAFQRDTTAEAAQQLIDHVRYTQHLAMVDDKFDPNQANWFLSRWQIRLNANGTYAIGSDADLDGDLIERELATNPLDATKRLDGGMITGDDAVQTPELDLQSAYGVNMAFSGGCVGVNPLVITFDHLGRPLLGDINGDVTAYPANRLLRNNCNITLSGGNEGNVTITITPETGYTFMN